MVLEVFVLCKKLIIMMLLGENILNWENEEFYIYSFNINICKIRKFCIKFKVSICCWFLNELMKLYVFMGRFYSKL